MTRKQWKVYWRQLRIIHRECRKADEDMFLFGTGCIEVGADVPDCVRHVPIEQIVLRAA